MKTFKGIPASEGIGIGSVYLKKEVSQKNYTAGSISEELEAFNQAVNIVASDIRKLADSTRERMGKEQAAIFEAHEMMLEDPEYAGGIREAIEGGASAPEGIAQVTNLFASMFEAMPDPYLRERAIDIQDIGRSLTAVVRGEKRFNPEHLVDAILVAEDLTPSDTALLSKEKVRAIVTAVGGATSHSAIIAKTLGIPAVMGVKDALHVLEDGVLAVVDGSSGEIIMGADEATLAHYREEKQKHEAYLETLKVYLNQHTVTLDGKAIEVSANIAKPAEAKVAHESGAEGVGLFRSEFIFMDRHTPPSEEEQFLAYKEALESMAGKPVIIRTMDIGGDKQVSYLGMEKEENPFLGYRAVRYCLDHTEFFKTQLRALMRASVYGKLRIMVPMIATVAEVKAVKALLEEVKAELKLAGIAYSEAVELGIMIEIPAAALKSAQLAKEVDFFSIGTNDLTQYTLAVDRMNANLSDLYNPMDPAVLSLIQMTIDNGHAAGIWVGMCGNASGNPTMIPLLLGMGLDEFSVSPVTVTEVRKAIMNLDMASLKPLAKQAVMAEDVSEVKALVTDWFIKHK